MKRKDDLFARVLRQVPRAKIPADQREDIASKIVLEFLEAGNRRPGDGEIRKRVGYRFSNAQRSAARNQSAMQLLQAGHTALGRERGASPLAAAALPSTTTIDRDAALERRRELVHHTKRGVVRPAETRLAIEMICEHFDPLWAMVARTGDAEIDVWAASALINQVSELMECVPAQGEAHERCMFLGAWITLSCREPGELAGPTRLASFLLRDQARWIAKARSVKWVQNKAPLWAWFGRPFEAKNQTLTRMNDLVRGQNASMPTQTDAEEIAELSAAVAGIKASAAASRMRRSRAKKQANQAK